MDFLNDIKEKTIIVCPNTVKEKLLTEINKYNRLINVKIITLEELKRLVYFDYDESAILYLIEKYDYSYEIAKNYIENIYFIEDKKYTSLKLSFLVKLKKELLEKKLLTNNRIFIDNNKDKPFIVFGYDYLDSFNTKLLSNFNYKIVSKKEKNNNINVYKFNTLEEELLYVINEIISLINKGIDINKIYLLNLDSDYNVLINELFRMHNLKIDINYASNILSTIVGKKAYNYLEEKKSFKDTLEYIKSFGFDKELNINIFSKFLNIFNKYIGLDYSFDTILKGIKYDLQNTKINNNNLKNLVRTSSINNTYFNDDEYVFLLGFNQGIIPVIHKDEDYISDKLKDELKLDKVDVLNKYEKESIINNIKSIKNITITYKEHYLDKDFYKSNLLNDKLFTENKIDKINTSFSNNYSNLKLAMMLDELIKYDKYNEELGLYYNSFNIRFMEYDNRFKGIKKEDLYNLIDNKLVLSYSTIDNFFKCQFRYYLDNILKLNKYEETFDTIIGSLFHYVLSHVYNENFNLEKDYNYFLKDKEFTNKEKFYLDKLKKELIIICDRLKEFQNDTGLTNVFTEKNIKIDKSTDIEVIFKGIVDKIMYKDYDGKTLISIIDYKTGNADIDIYNSIYGIGMQLIIYLYLITKSNLFDNYSCVGFYLQKILSSEVNIEKDKTYLDIKYNNLKLVGYSTCDMLKLERFDTTYENSKYIKGMKLTKKGFSSYSKVLTEEEMNDLALLVDKKVNQARDKILNCEFDINPKWISDDKELTGCAFCKYIDICNRKNEDIVNLKKYKDLSFLKSGDRSD